MDIYHGGDTKLSVHHKTITCIETVMSMSNFQIKFLHATACRPDKGTFLSLYIHIYKHMYIYVDIYIYVSGIYPINFYVR